MLPRVFACFLAVCTFLPEAWAQAAPAAPPEAAEPRVFVIFPGRLGSAKTKRAHRRLIAALEAQLGERFVATNETFKAIAQEKLLSKTLDTPPARKKLGERLHAERAIAVVRKGKRRLELRVYGRLGGEPTHVLTGRGRLPRLSKKDAKALAKLVAERAAFVFEPVATEEFTFDLGAVKTEPEPGEPAAEDAPAAPDEALPPRAVVVDSGGVAEEIARERRLHQLQTREPQPRFFATLGPSLGFRSFALSGPAAPHLIGVSTGAVTSAQGWMRLLPLRLLPALNHSRWADLFVDLRGRRAFTSARLSGTSVCAVDDDDAELSVGYRAPLLSHPWAPALGARLASGYERTAFRCALDVVSTLYPYAALSAHLQQPLMPAHLWLEADLGARVIALGEGERHRWPPFAFDLAVHGRFYRFLYLRFGVRSSLVALSLGEQLDTRDQRLSLYSEIGASF